MKRLTLGTALVLGWAAAATAAPLETPVGWRGDGTGVFPDDCRIVAEWSEQKHVVWKTPLPHAGNGSPIVVGRKAFVMCEPGWKSEAPRLVCIDAADGGVLWQREVDHFDLLPTAEQKRARDLRARWFEVTRRGMQYIVLKNDSPPEKAEAIQKRMEAEGILKEWFGKPRLGRQHRWAVAFKKEFNWPKPTWGWLVIGSTFPTPVSDGRHVYVVTAFNVVACYDLEGRRKWIKWFRQDQLAYHEVARFVHSPRLAHGRLIVHGNTRLRCLDAASGRVLWDIPSGQQLYMEGTPQVLQIGGTPVVATSSGLVVRLSDGAVMAEKIGLFAAGAGFVTDGRDTLFGVNGRAGGHYKCPEDRLFAPELKGYLVAVKLEPAGPDRLEPRLLWKLPYTGQDCPVYHEGTLYKGAATVDAAEGTVLEKTRRAPRSDQGWILADGKLIGLRYTGECPVLEVPSMEVLSVNRLDKVEPDPSREKVLQMSSFAKTLKPGKKGAWYVWNFGRSLPFASGNRLFIRSFDYLYAIGRKDEPFTPSAAFDPER